jgi:hypothetical protein
VRRPPGASLTSRGDTPETPGIAIIANPVSGRDVRRLLANAARSSIQDKVTIVRRVAIGAANAGAKKLYVLPDPHGIARKAMSTVQLDLEIEELSVPRTHDERETVAAAQLLRDIGVGAVVVLGGDGTNRVVAKGWPDAPIVPLSTGTNNVFPAHVEPTIGGAAAGLVASGAVELEVAARRCKVVHVDIDGEEPDFALVDAVLTADTVVGDRTPFDPSRLLAAVLAIADPAAVGVSPIGGLLRPCSRDDDAAVELRFGAGRTLTAPISPGLYTQVGIESCERIELGATIELRGPGILAFDGDRRRVVREGTAVRLRVERDGPWVIDVPGTMAAAAERGVYLR